MAIIPLTYKLSWYDPSKPGGVVTVQEDNANLATSLATQFSMEDIINTVSYSGGSIDGSGVQYALPVFTDTNTIKDIDLGAVNQVLMSGGAGAYPSWGDVDLTNLTPATITMTGLSSPSAFSMAGQNGAGGSIGMTINNTLAGNTVELQLADSGDFKIKDTAAAGYEYFVTDNSSRNIFLGTTAGMGVGNVAIGMGVADTVTAKLQVVGIAEHADNTAALLAGLTAGAFYRTVDVLKIVH
tara:strand:+ start:34 stop:753 length:720 start_codon:yes stop_codon:yes gene_type:complete